MTNAPLPVLVEEPDGIDNGRVVFLLGIMPRSGTNFLVDVVSHHPDCGSAHGIPEDFLFHNAHHLVDFVEGVYGSWNTYTRIDADQKRPLYRALGRGLERWLYSLTAEEWVRAGYPADDTPEPFKVTPPVRVARTPSVENLDLIADLTDSKVLIIVRDGRAVVESGMRSFGWLYEDSVQRWARCAALIRRVVDQHPQQFMWVRYEDLLHDRENTMRRAFAFIDVDPDRYDYAQEFLVRGSSTFFEKDKGINWDGTRPSKTFNPLERWKHWSTARLARFNWVAAEEMRQFGYDVTPHGGGLWTLYNQVLDLVWPLRHQLRPMARRLLPKRLRDEILWNRGKKYRARVKSKKAVGAS